MSNGENVIADCWEEIDDVKLNNQLDIIKKEVEGIQNQKRIGDTMPLRNGNIPPIMIAMRPDEGNYTTNKSAVKILRRPTQSNESRSLNFKPKQPIKTLQQREQEYAEARLRILGSAKNPEDELDAALDKLLSTKISSPISPITADSEIFTPNINTTNVSSSLAQQQLLLSSLTNSNDRTQQIWQRQPQNVFNSSIYDNIYFSDAPRMENCNMVNTVLASGDQVNYVLRMPRGPDNTHGFNIRR